MAKIRGAGGVGGWLLAKRRWPLAASKQNNMKPKKIEVKHGRGLASVEDALAVAVVSTTNTDAARLVGDALGVVASEQHAQGIEARGIGSALASVEQPPGELLLECQGQFDLALATRCARKLAGRMAADGHEVNEVSIEDAIGAGVVALAVWRSTGRGGADGEPETLPARVAWRGVVRSLSSDTLGESVALHSVGDDWLFAQALPQESRVERLVRWSIERRALGRSALLVRRVEALKAKGGRGRRAQVVERVGQAAALLLAGDNLEVAAGRAGFKSSGHTSAVHRLARSLRALGVGVGVADVRDKSKANKLSPDAPRRESLGRWPWPFVGVEPWAWQNDVVQPFVTLSPVEPLAVAFQSPAAAVTESGRVVRYDVEAVTKQERRRERRAWQGVQLLARGRGGWRPAVVNGEWRECVNAPDGEWSRACKAAAVAVEASAGAESGAAVRFYPDRRTYRAGFLGVWS
jgi:hypothetical protein